MKIFTLNLKAAKKLTTNRGAKFVVTGLLIFILMFVGNKSWGQTIGDYRTGTAAVAWATAANWQTWNGTAWVTAGSAPGSTNDVYIQSGHTATLAANASCNNLFISTGVTVSGDPDGRVALVDFALSVNGKLSCYLGAVSTTLNSTPLSITPSTSGPSSPITKTANSATGRIRIVGNSRTLTPAGEWGAFNTGATTTFDIEIALTAGQTATLVTAIKAYNWIFTSGTLDAGATRISADNGTTGQGNITINSGGTLISAQSAAGSQVISRGASSAMGTFTLNSGGTLQLSGTTPTISATSVTISGTVTYNRSGTQTLLGVGTGGSATVPSYSTLNISGSGVKTTALATTTSGTTTIDAGCTLATPTTYTANGAVAVDGSFQINQGGFANGTGTWTYGASGTLIYNNSSGSFGENGGSYWPTSSGPVNVTVAGAGGITMNVARTVSGTFQTAAGVVTANNLTLNGTAQINGGGFMTGTPAYGVASTLVYNTTSYTTTTNEFPAAGVHSVTVTAPSGTNTLTLDVDKTISGTFAIGAHTVNGGKSINAATITMGAGSLVAGTLTTSAAFTCSGASSISMTGSWNVTGFTKSTSTVAFTATGNLTTATSFYNLTNSGGTRSISANIDVENTLLVSGGDMRVSGGAGKSLTMSGAAATINITSGSITGTDVSAGNDISLIISGAQTTLTGSATINDDHEKKFFNVTVNSGSSLILSRGILCRYGSFTVDGTIQINSNGYIQTVPGSSVVPAYNASTGSLIYNNGGPYTNAGEWPGSSSPFNVTVQNNSSVTLSGTRGVAGALSVASGSSLDAVTFQITGAGNATINGTFKTSNSNGFSGGGSTSIANTITPITLGSGSTIEYYGASAQAVNARSDYANLTLSAAGAKTFDGNASVGGNFVVSGGSVTAPTTMTFNGTSPQNIAGLVYTNVAMSGAGTKTFTSDGSISGEMTFESGTGAIDFDGSSNNLVFTLRSNSGNTARIANTNGTTLSGNVTMERWIPQRGGSPTGGRAYRLLAPTVNTTGTIKANWMEGVNNTAIGTNIDPNAGYGTQISGSGGAANNFDVTQSNAPSLYFSSNGTIGSLTYTPLTSTTSGTGIATMNALTGYFLYIRGDRSVSMQVPLGTNMPTTSTTLRTRGTLVTGSVTSFTNAYTGGGAHNLVTNPYASPIDWNLVKGTSSNITDYYTLWDPNVGTRGGFVTVDLAGNNNNAESFANQYIQSGQAFFVESDGGLPAVIIEESDKAAGNNNTVFLVPPESFKTALYFVEDSGYRRIADGVNVLFDNSYSATVNAQDAKEMANWDENIAIDRETKHLAIETRPVILVRDTIPLYMNNMKERAYSFDFIPASFTNIGLKAELIDNFLNTRTLLSVVDTVSVNFTVTSDPASKATNRFMIVFGSQRPLAVDAITIKASQKNNGVQVDWTSKTETDMASYEVERSTLGTASFAKVNTTPALGNSTTPVNYNWFDANPSIGNNFYRVKGTDMAGNTKYSDIVKVTFGKGEPGIVVYPNPMEGRAFKMDMNNMAKGTYLLNLYNNMGQLVYTEQLVHDGSQVTRTINLKTDIAKGAYQLQLNSANGFKTTQTIFKN